MSDNAVTREVFKYALTSTVSTTAAPGGSKLLEGILFSRRFIIWYNIVLAILLLLFTAWHWSGGLVKWVRHKRGGQTEGQDVKAHSRDAADADKTALVRESEQDGSSSSSSSSSHTGPIQADCDTSQSEQTPLLSTSPRRTRSSPSSQLSSWLMYQPANVPIVNKTLPSNLTTIVVLLFLGLNAFFLFYRAVPTIPTIFIFADRAGLLFVANLPLLYLFAAKYCPLSFLTGHSYENLNIFHRRLGEVLCLTAVLHVAGMLVVWYTILLPRGINFWQLLSIPLIWLGLIAFAAYELLYVTSLSSLRQRFYELFLVSHIVLQVVALVFLWLHHHGSRPYVGIAVGIFLLDRILFRFLLKTRTLQADLSVLEDGETVLVSANWQLIDKPSIWSRITGAAHIKHGWAPGEHVFLTVPALAKKHTIQAHPFTIASAAPTTSTDSHAWLNLIIRARNGFSGDLLRYAQSHSTVDVRLDGPYGSHHALDMLHGSASAVAVAGGSGIAVAFPLIWSLLVSSNERPSRHVTLIWIVHDALHIDWIGQERLDELREKGLEIVIPAPTRKAGRPDVQALVESAIEKQCRQDTTTKIGVVVSGPDGMNRTVRNTCAMLVSNGRNVDVSVEKFGW